ncbi:uncharacterized protein CDAR_530841 [Caerostris darwini]|uniref:Uncharacterized protein n=1 Tax=Caerostris darwini TaxID=1538125 RepID=A0AAV4VST0_9ARAC|nr:uncharacterized protein CDAR_530841 [Caerostris darwini]
MPNKTESIKMKGIWSSERKEGCFRRGKNKQKEGNLARNQHNNGGKQSTIQLSGIEIKEWNAVSLRPGVSDNNEKNTTKFSIRKKCHEYFRENKSLQWYEKKIELEVNFDFSEIDNRSEMRSKMMDVLYAVDKTDEEYAGSPEPPKVRQQHVDPKMIIIMVVLAVMFIGICVALHLFSKARFRNHRTIFNSPHPRLMHIKLGKKKGRRRASHTSLEVPGSRQLSICSQLSPVQSRRGSQATSPESIQKARKSNGEKKETASHAHKTHKPDSSEKGAPRATSDAAANGPGSPTVIVARGNSKPSNPNTSVSARV